jgi:hypothetical protein
MALYWEDEMSGIIMIEKKENGDVRRENYEYKKRIA